MILTTTTPPHTHTSTHPQQHLVEGSHEEVQQQGSEAVAAVEVVPPKDTVEEDESDTNMDVTNHETLPTAKRPAMETQNKELFQRTLLAARIVYDQQAAGQRSTTTTRSAVIAEASSTPVSFVRTVGVEKETQKSIEDSVLATVFSMTEPVDSGTKILVTFVPTLFPY
jgi:hypothetical protein